MWWGLCLPDKICKNHEIALIVVYGNNHVCICMSEIWTWVCIIRPSGLLDPKLEYTHKVMLVGIFTTFSEKMYIQHMYMSTVHCAWSIQANCMIGCCSHSLSLNPTPVSLLDLNMFYEKTTHTVFLGNLIAAHRFIVAPASSNLLGQTTIPH